MGRFLQLQFFLLDVGLLSYPFLTLRGGVYLLCPQSLLQPPDVPSDRPIPDSWVTTPCLEVPGHPTLLTLHRLLAPS